MPDTGIIGLLFEPFPVYRRGGFELAKSGMGFRDGHSRVGVVFTQRKRFRIEQYGLAYLAFCRIEIAEVAVRLGVGRIELNGALVCTGRVFEALLDAVDNSQVVVSGSMARIERDSLLVGRYGILDSLRSQQYIAEVVVPTRVRRIQRDRLLHELHGLVPASMPQRQNPQEIQRIWLFRINLEYAIVNRFSVIQMPRAMQLHSEG